MKNSILLAIVSLFIFQLAFGQEIPKEILDVKTGKVRQLPNPPIKKQGNFVSPQQKSGSAVEWGSPDYVKGELSPVCYTIATESNGDFYAAGMFSGFVFFDGSTSLQSVGTNDIFIAKYGSTGNLIWVKPFPSPPKRRGMITDLELDANGDIYAVGNFLGDLTLGSTTLTSNGEQDVFLTKLTADGTPIWAVSYGDSEVNSSEALAVDDSGNAFVLVKTSSQTQVLKYDNAGANVGNFENAADINDIAVNGNTLILTGVLATPSDFGGIQLNTSNTNWCSFIAKSDMSFNFDWAKAATAVDPSDLSNGQTVDIDDAGNIYLSGFFNGEISFDNTSTVKLQGFFVSKFNSSGGIEWMNESFADQFNSLELEIDGQGTPWLAGSFFGDLDFQGSPMLSVPGFSNFLVKFDASNGQASLQEEVAGSTFALTTDDSQNVLRSTVNFNYSIEKISNSGSSTWTVQTNSQAGLSGGFENGSVKDDQGNVYFLSDYSGNPVFMGNQLSSAQGVLVAKLNDDGTLGWYTTMQSDLVAFSRDITLDDSGNVIVSGRFQGQMTIGSAQYFAEEQSGFISKFDVQGNLVFFKIFNGNSFWYGLTAIGQDIYVSGSYSQTIDFDGLTITELGLSDLFYAKLDANGNTQWLKSAGGTSTEYSAFMSKDGNGNLYLAMEVISEQFTMDGTTYTFQEGDGNFIYAKLDSDGNVDYVKSFAQGINGTPDQNSWPQAITTDSSGNSYVIGWRGKDCMFGPYTLNGISGSGFEYYYNWFVTKIDPAGNVLWAKGIEKKQYDWPCYEVSLDAQGSLYFGGRFRDSTFVDGVAYSPLGGEDLMVMKYSTDGNLEWLKTASSTPEERGYMVSSVLVKGVDDLFVLGYFTAELDFGNSSLCASNRNTFFVGLGEGGKVSIPSILFNIEDLNLFPNPTSENLNFQFSLNASSAVSISVYDVLGKRLFSQNAGQLNIGMHNYSLDVEQYPAGHYFIQVKTDNELRSLKFEKIN